MMDFECHITVLRPDKETCRRYEAVGRRYGWHTSVIERDPVLGKKAYFYFNAHDSNYVALYTSMETMVRRLRAAGVLVVREKIELIMHDCRTAPFTTTQP